MVARHYIGVTRPSEPPPEAPRLLRRWFKREWRNTTDQLGVPYVYAKLVRRRPEREGHHPTEPGHEWVCHAEGCFFRATDIDEAEAHLWARPENFTHWIHEHPDGSRYRPAKREMHTSDTMVAYLSPVPPEVAAEDAKRFRRRCAEWSPGPAKPSRPLW